MRTDDRVTRQRDEVEGDEAKVVRLSDWLAPDDELVPFGPRAHAQAAAREQAMEQAARDSSGEPPAASGFWDGDPSVHTAVPGPGLFGEPGGPTAEPRRYRLSVPAWRPNLPSLHPFDWRVRTRERTGDLVDRIRWPWAAVGVAFVALAVIALVVTLAGSSTGRHDTAAQASIGEQAPGALDGTLGEIGTATRAAAVSDLRRLPPVDTAGRAIGAAARHAPALRARNRRPVSPTSVPSSSTSESVETPTATQPSAETTSAPSQTEPVQTTSNPTSPTGSGSSSAGGGGSGGSGSSSGSEKQSTFGATGSLGPGSSPNG